MKARILFILAALFGFSFGYACDHCKTQAIASRCTFSVLQGQEMIPYLEELVGLKMDVYRDYPYLWEGDREIGRASLGSYAASEGSVGVIVQKDGVIVGAIIGMPFGDTQEECQRPFHEQALATDDVYYLGELLLLPAYESYRLRSRLYQTFEQFVQGCNAYGKIAVCEVVRSEDDPQAPASYFDFYAFWESKGYQMHTELVTELTWTEIDGQEAVSHQMVYLIKDLGTAPAQ